MRLSDVKTIGNKRYFETTFTYELTIDYKEIFLETLNLCKEYSNYERLLQVNLYDILLNISSYDEDKQVVRENDTLMVRGYIDWLMDNWNILKTSKDISKYAREMIQKYVNELNKKFKS